MSGSSAAVARRVSSMLGWDVRLQRRYGIYAVYAVVTVVYVLGLRLAPAELRPLLLVLTIFSDPVVLGFYFVAALVLFEKGDGVLDALVTSPLSSRAYLASKVLSLSLLAVVASLVLAVAGVGTAFDPFALVAGVGLTSALFVLVGFVVVARFDSLNAYFMLGIPALAPFSIPLLGTLGVAHSPLFHAIPTQATLVLLGGAFGPVPPWEVGYAVAYLVAWIGLAWIAAERAFDRHVVRGATGAEHGAARPTRRRRPRRRTDAGADRRGPVATLALADLRNWSRDPLLQYVGLAPLLAAIVGRFLVPVVGDWLSPWVDLADYPALVLSLFLFLAPFLLGFVAGLFVIEERDQRVVEALWTTPLTGRGYLAYRGAAVVGLSFAYAFVVVPVLGVVAVPIWLLVPVAAVGALWAALGGLLLAAVASNSVEAVALSKLFGVILLAPILAIAALPEPVEYVAGVDPLYWPMKALVVGLERGPVAEVWLLLAVGAALHLVAIAALVRRFRP